MSDAKKNDPIPVYVDGEQVMVPPGTNMIEAAAMVGKEVPHYCYHPHLSTPGNCRMCLVELGMPGKDRATGEPMLNEDGSPKIMFMPKPAIACATKAAPNMHIKTDSEMVKGCREGVMEFLLVNHPLDCPICDQAGECRLQEFATDYGRGYSRFIEQKNVKPKRTKLGPRVVLDDERCILCSRCIRFMQEIPEDDCLGFIDRGSYSTLTCFPGKDLSSNYSLNTVDICPVGALTSTDFRFKMRVWFLKEVKSIDTESSVGCNTLVGQREGKIYRITPRRNDHVNDSWMPDSGRALYKRVDAENRLKEYRVGGAKATAESALKAASELMKDGGVAVVGSGQSSVEEQYLTRRLAEACGENTPRFTVHRQGEGDGILLSADRNPNTRGALVTGLISELPQLTLPALAEAIDAGKVRVVVSVNEDLPCAGLSEEQLAKVRVVYLGTHANSTVEKAEVVIPTLTVFEKNGTFINQQFRLQKFHQVVPGPTGVFPDVLQLSRLAQMLGAEVPRNLGQVWEALASEVDQLKDLSFQTVPDQGVLLDAAAFGHLSFCETAGLHYDLRDKTVTTPSN